MIRLFLSLLVAQFLCSCVSLERTISINRGGDVSITDKFSGDEEAMQRWLFLDIETNLHDNFAQQKDALKKKCELLTPNVRDVQLSLYENEGLYTFEVLYLLQQSPETKIPLVSHLPLNYLKKTEDAVSTIGEESLLIRHHEGKIELSIEGGNQLMHITSLREPLLVSNAPTGVGKDADEDLNEEVAELYISSMKGQTATTLLLLPNGKKLTLAKLDFEKICELRLPDGEIQKPAKSKLLDSLRSYEAKGNKTISAQDLANMIDSITIKYDLKKTVQIDTL